jgi:hypothetical protein
MMMERFFEVFQFRVVEFDQFESFLEVFGIYPVTKVRGFFCLFEKIEHTFAVVLEKDQKYNNYDKDNKS